MRKYLARTFILMICMTQLGSFNQVQAIEKVKNEVAQGQKITITYKKIDYVIKNQEGVPMLTVQGNTPQVTIEDNRKASCEINDYYEGQMKAFEKTKKQYVKMAKKDYSMRNDEEKAYWMGYGLGRTYTSARVDDQVISFIENDYSDTGGAHPNATRYAQNFNPHTGERLTLKAITTNEDAAVQAINAYILKETKQYPYKDYFFEGYEKDIKNILTEDTWYFSDEGLVIICNEYIISPHVVGILEFTIPYNELTFIKPDYLLKN